MIFFVIMLALWFIVKLRFPPDVPIYTESVGLNIDLGLFVSCFPAFFDLLISLGQ